MAHIVSFDEVPDLIKSGKVGIIPTDTLYGVVASALNKDAVERLYRLKDRQAKPGTIIINLIQDLECLGVVAADNGILQRYWPGAVSIVFPSTEAYLHQGKGSLAVRLPAHVATRGLLKITGPLLTSSANTPGAPPATTIAEAIEYFGDSMDFYVDGGFMSNEKASTVIRVKDGAVEVLREGAVKLSLES